MNSQASTPERELLKIVDQREYIGADEVSGPILAISGIHNVGYNELVEITDRWVEAALTLSPLDLRKMERLAAAQDRRRGRARVTD